MLGTYVYFCWFVFTKPLKLSDGFFYDSDGDCDEEGEDGLLYDDGQIVVIDGYFPVVSGGVLLCTVFWHGSVAHDIFLLK